MSWLLIQPYWAICLVLEYQSSWSQLNAFSADDLRISKFGFRSLSPGSPNFQIGFRWKKGEIWSKQNSNLGLLELKYRKRSTTGEKSQWTLITTIWRRKSCKTYTFLLKSILLLKSCVRTHSYEVEWRKARHLAGFKLATSLLRSGCNTTELQLLPLFSLFTHEATKLFFEEWLRCYVTQWVAK